ncbi:MAG: hypothetical protein LUF81_03090 [Clostridiales bacterium]|nr:hypothetical protein [Clostridiales bacterium]
MKRQLSGVRVLTVPDSSYRLSWLLLTAGFLMGALTGHIVAGLGLEQLTPVLEHWVEEAVCQGTEPQPLSLLWRAAQSVGLAAILSFSGLGVLGLPMLVGARGFLTACTVSAFVRTWGYPGLAAGAVWVCAGDGILLAMLLAVAVPGWTVSWELATGRRKHTKLSRQVLVQCIGFCLAGLAMTVAWGYLVWCWLTPMLLTGQ